MIGLLPCAGTAERFNGLPKYLLPCPNGGLLECHVNAIKATGCNTIMIGANEDNNHSLHDFIGKKASVYTAQHHETMTQTVLSVYKYVKYENPLELKIDWEVKDQTVLFGMPDTYFDFPLVYERLATRLNESNADVVLAVFKTRPEQHRQGGMVSVSHNQVVDIVDKPETTSLQYIWGAMAWRARFWSCLTPDMPHVGYGVKVAIEQGLDVQAVSCAGGFWDVGTFERYVEMLKANT